MYKLLRAILAVMWGFHSHQSMPLISDRPSTDAGLAVQSLTLWTPPVQVALFITVQYYATLHITVQHCTGTEESMCRLPESVELPPGPPCLHRKADWTQYPSMRKLLHAVWPDSHCFASVKNAVENKPSASAKSKNKCFLYNRNLPVLTFAKLLLSRIAWASPWPPPWLVLMPTNCHNNFFEWSDLQKLGTRNQIDILLFVFFFNSQGLY